jgi:DegV family protein with EDD domain
MRRIRIVADSSADILALEGVEYAVAPMKIITAEREFVDDEALDVEDMAAFLYKYKGQSKSSCPNVSDWLETFGDADDVICVTITSALSGSYNAACTAKTLYEAEGVGRRVFVLDTLSAGPEISLIVEKLQDMIRAGKGFEEICQDIEAYRQRTGLCFMLKSLNNFANNGRVSPAVAKIAGFVGICIVGKASDEGTLEPTHKCRGEAKSLETLVSDMEKYGLQSGRVYISHCANETAAHRLKELLIARLPKVSITIHKLRGLCSFYAEQGGLLVGFEKGPAMA